MGMLMKRHRIKPETPEVTDTPEAPEVADTPEAPEVTDTPDKIPAKSRKSASSKG
jgi:hypothetical protein